jgi:hypothetical protein
MAVTDRSKAAPGLSPLHFSAASFDQLIRAHGVTARMRMARRCACWRLDAQAPDPACKLCHPYGFIWDAPFTTTVHSQNRKPRRGYDSDGQSETGDVSFTFLTEVIPTFFARVVLPTARVVVDDMLVKGTTDIIRWSEVLDVDRADYTVRNPPEGSPYEVENVSLKIEGKDADPDIRIEGPRVTWLNPDVPDGTQYTVRFTTHPEFVAWEIRERQEGGQLMPYTALCKRIEFLQHPQGTEQLSYHEPAN